MIGLTDEGKVNRVESRIMDNEKTAYVYGMSWCRVEQDIRAEVKVGDIDKALEIILKMYKAEEHSKELETLDEDLDEVEDDLGMWIIHCLRGSFYVEAEKIATERAEQWFNTREVFFDGEEAAIGIALKKSRARKQYLDNNQDNDDWNDEDE